MDPLTEAEQKTVDEVYSRVGIKDGTTSQKNHVLQKFIGPRVFHCQGESSMSPPELEVMELRANERIYLTGIWKK